MSITIAPVSLNASFFLKLFLRLGAYRSPNRTVRELSGLTVTVSVMGAGLLLMLILASGQVRANGLELWTTGSVLMERGDCSVAQMDQWCDTYFGRGTINQSVPGFSCTTTLPEGPCATPYVPAGTAGLLYCGNGDVPCGGYYSVAIGKVGVACPPGSAWNSTLEYCVIEVNTDKMAGLHQCSGDNGPGSQSHNPIDFSYGNKVFGGTDYRGVGAFPIVFSRTYNAFGSTAWAFSYKQRIYRAPDSNKATIWRPSGQSLNFYLVNGVWEGDPDISARLEMSGDSLTWIYTLPDNTREYFNTSNGRLTSIRNPGGLVQTITYQPDSWNFTVTDPQGDSLFVRINSNGLTPDYTVDAQGYKTTYEYGNTYDTYLNKVIYPGGGVKQYVYNEPFNSRLITSVIDENGHTSNTVTYDEQFRAISSSLANNAERVTVSYNDNGTTTVTNALGKASTYTFETIHDVRKITHVDGEPSTNCQGSAVDYAYDTNGYLVQKIDARGIATQYVRGTGGLELSRTEVVGQPEERIVTTGWDSNLRKPLTITSGNTKTTYIYDAQGRTLSRTLMDLTTLDSRTTSYSYNALGLIETIDGPRTDVTDVTTFGYDASGSLVTVANALSHVTTVVTRDVKGRPTLVRDPNGLETALVYDSRGRVTTITKGSEVTSLVYDGVGNVTSVTPPSGAVLNYSYDDANRLIKIANAYGAHISYTLDLQGNRTAEKVYNGSGTILYKTHTYLYDELSRLIKSIGAAGQTTQYSYDGNDNLSTTTDPLQQTYSNAYDGLNRLISQTDPLNGTTSYGYDTQDRLTQVTDANGNATTYTYDGLRNLTAQHSPDTGTTTYTYDSAGNVLSKTDAKSQTTTYAYDALNRLTGVTYADSSTAAYTYDNCTNGIGHLCALSNVSGTTTWQYDSHGRITSRSEGIVVGGATKTLTTGYSYNSGGQLATTTYPSGLQVGYSYYLSGQVSALSLNGQPLMASIYYYSFGQVKAWTWSGGGISVQRNRDLDWRLSNQTLGSITRTLSYDDNSNITAITDPANTQSYGYDALNRITSGSDNTFNLAWTYDANGNRLSETDTGATTPYTIDTNSNRLQSVGTAGYQHDANGQLINEGTHSYQYDARNRLVSVDSGATGEYRYNAQGQRVYKKWGSPAEERLFVYDEYRLLGEYDASGTAIQETIWLGELPVVTVRSGNVYYIHSDHLGTPRVITNTAGTELWRWDSEPFGEAAANEDVDGDGVNLTYNLRFPGQYYDVESGKHYNYFRDYDPATGRYLQSDPIGISRDYSDPSLGVSIDLGIITPGLGFGIPNHLYGYVGQNPLNGVDPVGLDTLRTGVMKAIARGDSQELRALLDIITDPKLKKIAQEAIEKFESRAGDWISRQCKGSINREFPDALRDKTLEEIRRGSSAEYKKAWKLLNDKRFQK